MGTEEEHPFQLEASKVQKEAAVWTYGLVVALWLVLLSPFLLRLPLAKDFLR